MHNRDRLTPVALPREDPVTHAVVDGFLRLAALFQPRHQPLPTGLRGQAVELPGVDHVAWVNVRGGELPNGRSLVVRLWCRERARAEPRRGNDLDNRQAKGGGELKVTLVVPRHGHNGPGAIAHQDIISDPDGNALIIDGIDGYSSQVDARFGALDIAAHDVALPPTLFHITLHGFSTLWGT